MLPTTASQKGNINARVYRLRYTNNSTVAAQAKEHRDHGKQGSSTSGCYDQQEQNIIPQEGISSQVAGFILTCTKR
jgi:hypothetical protein